MLQKRTRGCERTLRQAIWQQRARLRRQHHLFVERAVFVGRMSYAERDPDLVAAAKALLAERPRLSLRKISLRLAEKGFVVAPGRPYAAMSVRNMLLG